MCGQFLAIKYNIHVADFPNFRTVNLSQTVASYHDSTLVHYLHYGM